MQLRNLTVVVLMIALLSACIAPPIAASPATAPAKAAAPIVLGPVAELAGKFELVQLIVDFPSGTWTQPHTHGGVLLVTVLSGKLTVRDEQGSEKTYKANESFTETPGTYLEVGNAGQEKVTVSTAALLPKGAKLSTTKEGISTDKAPPGPTTVYQVRVAANSVAAP